jgi:hypothetical protein
LKLRNESDAPYGAGGVDDRRRFARKFRTAPLGNQTRSGISGGGEVPNGRKADHGGCKAANENVE